MTNSLTIETLALVSARIAKIFKFPNKIGVNS
jgi:hypothetical protein